jgi:hypothetical protein
LQDKKDDVKLLRKILNYLDKAIKEPRKIISFLSEKELFNWMPDRLYLKLNFYARMGRRLHLKNPKTFNQKIQWLKLNDRKPIYTRLVDKYEVRNYITKHLGQEYLIPLIGVYDSFDEINFDELPNKFVLKCTHDSGGLVICTDKDELDIKAARDKINKSLKRNFYYIGREWPYKGVKPRIICEQYMVDESGTELKDYKFLCFNGTPKCSFVCLNRNSPNGLNVDFYDIDWNPMSFERHYPSSGIPIKRPENYNEMIEIAKKMSKDIPFVRIDFYEIDGQIYFGEFTLYPGCGYEEFSPESYDEILGSWIELPVTNS